MKKTLNSTHQFNIYLAKELGFNSAVILYNLIYWLEKNEANGVNYHEGRYWTYNSISAFADLFIYLSERQIRYALDKLEEDNIIMTGNFNKVGFDKTKWYTLTDYGYAFIQNVQRGYTKCTKDVHKVSTPIPDINTDINTDKSTYVQNELFEEFWKEYPNKKNKKKAKDKYLKDVDKELHQIIMNDLNVRKKSKDWTKEDGRFIPHPTTYLNGERWNDEIEANDYTDIYNIPIL